MNTGVNFNQIQQQKDVVSTFFFKQTDTNENKVLEQDEVNNIQQSKELSQEEAKQFISNDVIKGYEITEDNLESVVLMGADKTKAAVMIKGSERCSA